MFSLRTAALLLVFHLSALSLLHCRLTGPTSFNNRSKIHIIVDVDSKDSKNVKGTFNGVSKNDVKVDTDKADISSDDDDTDDDDEDYFEDGDTGVDNTKKKGSAFHSLKKGQKPKPKHRDAKNIATGKKKHHGKGKRKTKKNSSRKKGKRVRKHHHKRRKHRRKGKKRRHRSGKRKTKSKKWKGKKHQRRKKKKAKKNDLKHVPNPEGRPDPHNLKIPLTFMREDIHNETTKNDTNKEASNSTFLVGRDSPGANETGAVKTDTTTPPEVTSNSSKEAASKIRHLTKQIVIATLKEVSRLSKNETSQNVTQARTNLKPGNPLLERMEG